MDLLLPLEVAAGGGVAAAAAKHFWWDRRTKQPPEPPEPDYWELLLAQWPDIAAAAGIAGAHLEGLSGTEYGWEADLQLVPPQTAKNALGVIPALESLLRVRIGGVRVEPDWTRADRARLRVLATDPLEKVIDWPGPAARSILDPVRLGVFETGDPVMVRLAWRMTLLAGLTGSGKSGTMQLLVGTAVAAPDAVAAGIDFKGGVELGPWGDALWRLATSRADAGALLRDTRAIVDQRLGWMHGRGLDTWPVSPQHPALIVAVDEQGELVRQGGGKDCELVRDQESIMERGRAAGVWMANGIQRPTMENLGSDTIRAQSGNRICHRMKEPGDTDMAFYKGASNAGWTAHLLGRPGTFLIESEEYRTPRPARAYRVTKQQVRVLAAEHAPRQPRLEPVKRARGSGPATVPADPVTMTEQRGSM